MKKLSAFVLSTLLVVNTLPSVTSHAAAAPKAEPKVKAAAATAAASNASAFVSASGTKFMVDGHSFYFGGANSYDLFTYGDGSSTQDTNAIENKYMDKGKIDTIMQQMEDDGVSVLRTWGFSNESWHGFEPQKGQYNEAEFMEFDYIMYSAQKHNIKVIITLENYWSAYGGIDQKLQWEGLNSGNDAARTQFFTNADCIQHYKDYAAHFINRINHYTGVAYKDDPTIFAWDLMNEPRYVGGPVNEDSTGTTLRKWVDNVSSYMKGLDPNHMVSVGIEGHGLKYGFGGDEGNPFVYIQQSPYIDFCVAHPYPDEQWANLTPAQAGSLTKAWINDAHNVVGKPFVIEEFNTHNNKDQYWPAVFGAIDSENAAGGMFWEYNSQHLSDFTILHGDPILTYYKQFAADQAAKSAPENSVNPASVTFDKAADKQADIPLTLNFLSGNSLAGIYNGSTALRQGSDYTVSGNSVVLLKSFLNTLPYGNTTLTFNASAGNNVPVKVTVTNSAISNSTISPTAANFDKNPLKQADITVTLSSNGNTFTGISNGSSALVAGTDYTVSGSTVDISKNYLATLGTGKANLTFNFNQGINPQLTVTVADTTGQEVIDNFESYSGSNANLQSAYSVNTNGNALTLGLSSSNRSEGSYGMSYQYTIGSPNYAGTTKSLGGKDCSGYAGISFWMLPDGSNRDLTIQLEESSGEYWEATIPITGTTAGTVQIPFSKFAHPSWYSGGNGVLDLDSISQYSIYVGQGSGSTGSGTLYFDDFKLYASNGTLDSTISPVSATFDKNQSKQSDLTETLTPNGNTFTGITNGSATLNNGTDYTVSGNTVVISKNYLAKLGTGTANLTFNFNKGTNPQLTVTVVDTTGQNNQKVIDNFENYGGSTSSLQSAYNVNSNGNALTLGLSSSNHSDGSYGLSYQYTIGSPNYAGATKNLNNTDFSGFSGLSFWMLPDGSNRDLTIQIKESSGEYWEATVPVTGTTATTVQIPFSKFAHPSWYSGGNGVLDLNSIAEYSIYIGQGSGSAGSGTLYFDDFSLYTNTQAAALRTRLPY